MTSKDKRLLIKQAAKLATLGVVVEKERSSLKKLVERGVSYNDPTMAQTYERFVKADSEWKQLEAEHLLLRKKSGME